MLICLAALGGLGWLLARWRSAPLAIEAGIDLQRALSDEGGRFSPVRPGRTFDFPTDHGEHPGFKTEWWYFTGNLFDGSGRAYGYQLTFFRSALAPPEGARSTSPWTPRDVVMAHFALSDPRTHSFHPFERFSRRALGLAGVSADAEGLSVWLEDWRARRGMDGLWTLQAAERLPDGRPLRLSLQLQESKPPVLQGDKGYSRKGPGPGHASYYVSITRLRSQGEIELGTGAITVTGNSWFDHEWSSAALAPGLVGWDWFSLQLEDGTDLMLYLLRYGDGRTEPASSGTLVDRRGKASSLAGNDFRVEVLDHHRSPRGVDYPSRWRIELPSKGLALTVKPRMADQEMASSVPYWEGAVTAQGERQGHPLSGSGFVEMTGYETSPNGHQGL
jgi:predicted secreted hydrolase